MTRKPISLLWTSNILLPAAARALGLPESPFGGWLSVTTEHLARRKGLRIGVAMRAPVRRLRRLDLHGISYYALPQTARDMYDIEQSSCDAVLADFAPDLLHAEGTEMAHTRRFLKTWHGPKVVSLQGVINGHTSYQFGGLTPAEFLSLRHPRHAGVGLALLANHLLRFRPRLSVERETINLADHILGRTLWDQAHAYRINPNATYHHCPRILRDSFYTEQWSLNDIEPYSLFVGNGASALKGAHFAVRALAQLRNQFPQARLYIAGRAPSQVARKPVQRLFDYPVYLRNLIRDLGVADRVTFTGELNAVQMAERMRKSHVFILPSLIENSPNSLGEAMLMGVPSVASYAGGVPSMATDESEVLMYRANDSAMLAFQVQRLFRDDSLSYGLSKAARKRAIGTHNPDAVIDTLLAVYQRVLEGASGP